MRSPVFAKPGCRVRQGQPGEEGLAFIRFIMSKALMGLPAGGFANLISTLFGIFPQKTTAEHGTIGIH